MYGPASQYQQPASNSNADTKVLSPEALRHHERQQQWIKGTPHLMPTAPPYLQQKKSALLITYLHCLHYLHLAYRILYNHKLDDPKREDALALIRYLFRHQDGIITALRAKGLGHHIARCYFKVPMPPRWQLMKDKLEQENNRLIEAVKQQGVKSQDYTPPMHQGESLR